MSQAACLLSPSSSTPPPSAPSCGLGRGLSSVLVCFLLFVILFGVLGWPPALSRTCWGGERGPRPGGRACPWLLHVSSLRPGVGCGSQQLRGQGCQERVPEGLGELWRWLDVAQEGGGPAGDGQGGERCWAPWLLCAEVGRWGGEGAMLVGLCWEGSRLFCKYLVLTSRALPLVLHPPTPPQGPSPEWGSGCGLVAL